MENQIKKLKTEIRITPEQQGHAAVDLLAAATGLSKSALKDAMSKGAVWLQPARGSARRLRRAQAAVYKDDVVKINYDESILKAPVPQARLLKDEGSYGLWYKPAGLLAQGNEYGDHLALLRVAELALRKSRNDQNATTWLVHRLDREASGLMLIAYQKRAAAALSEMFQKNLMEKFYWAQVVGETPLDGMIEMPLDDKYALSCYRRLAWNVLRNRSTLEVTIETGRQHQIRRHLEAIGHPLLGDPRYGQDNKNRDGMKLVAWKLRFECPMSGKPRDYDLAQLAPDLFNPLD